MIDVHLHGDFYIPERTGKQIVGVSNDQQLHESTSTKTQSAEP